MIYCAIKNDYVDQEMTCVKKECPYYDAENDSCLHEEKIEEKENER